MCIAVLEKVDAALEGKEKKDKVKIEAAIEKFCAKKDISQQDKKLVRGLWLKQRVRLIVILAVVSWKVWSGLG